MAISFIGQAAAAATTVTIPAATAAGDLIIIFAYRNAITAPTLPAGYTSASTSSGNANSYIVGYKIAVGSDTSGTWTNANVLQVVVYRGTAGIASKAGQNNAAATTTAIPALTMWNADGNSWVVAFAGSKQTTSQGTPLAGATTSRGTQVGTTSDTIAADTNAGVSSFSATTSANGASATSVGVALELVPTGYPLFVQQALANTTSASPATTAGITTTVGNLIVVSLTGSVTGTFSMSDSKGNTWTQIGTSISATPVFTAMFYSVLTVAGSAHTFSGADSGSLPTLALAIQEYSGVTSTPFDQTAQASGSGGTASSGNTPTTTQALELVVGAMGNFSSLPIAGTGYSNAIAKQDGASSNTTSLESKLVSATGAYSSTFTNVPSAWAIFVATFKATAGTPAPSVSTGATLMMMGI